MLLIQLISVMHILLGALVLLNHGALHIASTKLLVDLIPEYHLRAAFYAFAGLTPAIWAWYPHRTYGWTSLVPQMVLVGLSAVSASFAILSGSYADGVPRSPLFIAADQLPYLLFLPAYMLGIKRAETGNGRH